MAGRLGAALKGIRRRGVAGRIVRCLTLLLALLLVYLVLGEKPWDLREDIAARLAQEKDPTLEQNIAVGLYWAAAINAGMCLLLLASSRWWGRDLDWKDSGERLAASPTTIQVGPRLFWIGLTGAVVLAGALRWNLAHRSLWWDELWCVKHAVVGRHDPIQHESEELRFRDAGLDAALWYYKKPTNHYLHSTLSNLAVGAWQKLGGKDQTEFSDFVVRLPAYLAALASIAGIGILLRWWRYDVAGLTAAWLLAVHPEHIRYGVDARSYSMTVLFAILGCLALSALYFSRSGSWRPWLLFGLSQFFLVWNFLYAVWLAAAFFVAAGIILFKRSRDREARVRGVIRLVFVNVLAGMTFIQLFAPNFIQMKKWMITIHQTDPHQITWPLFQDTFSKIFFGMHWSGFHRIKGEDAPGVLDGIAEGDPLSISVMVLTVILMLAGMVHVSRRCRVLAVILWSVWGAGTVHLLTNYLTQQYYYPRFLIYLVVPLVAGLALGLERVMRIARREAGDPLTDVPRAIPVLVYLGMFAGFAWPEIKLLQQRPYAPLRNVAEFLEARNAESESGIVVVGYGLGGDIMRIYYPRTRFARSLAEVEKGAAVAAENGKPLYLFYGYSSFNRAMVPDGFSWIDDPEKFSEVAHFVGIEPDFYYWVLKWVGAGSAGEDGR